MIVPDHCMRMHTQFCRTLTKILFFAVIFHYESVMRIRIPPLSLLMIAIQAIPDEIALKGLLGFSYRIFLFKLPLVFYGYPRLSIMKKIVLAFLVLFTGLPLTAFAETAVVEGDEAKTLYAADQGKAQVLIQKNREFVLRKPGGNETRSPATLTVQAGERFYIANEEDTFIHNVYDLTDTSWVLKKQLPASIAAVTFSEPGKHQLRCAIHPAMKIDVDVR